MGKITIRIDDDLETQIDKWRGDKPKSDFYRDIIKEYLTTPDDQKTTPVVSQNSDYTRSLEQQISDLRDDKIKLMTLLNQEQALHMQTQRLLPPAPQKKKWWEFLKR